ncbi:MAG: putative selenate reductase subunit YgfK [Bacteroidales bacterium]
MATDTFYPIPINKLLSIILKQYDSCKQIFGIPKKLFYSPKFTESFHSYRYGKLLETPIGVAAGPHTQLAQNIIAAWLNGARFIELKTVQTLDDIEVAKPCIDMQDEGYNCEWSQELSIQQSFEQYLDAWIIIHVLHHKFGLKNKKGFGTLFNMSIGYNYEGIQNANVQWFLDKMKDASKEIEEKVMLIQKIYPEIINIDISPTISDNVTLSTMHGCPPQEIEKIGHYLIAERKLHTAVKFNPTLLGRDAVHEHFNRTGFETIVPDDAFEHDPTFSDAVQIIKNLQQTANENQLHFSLKITNTLESLNHKDIFPPNQERMYMSGRALHPLSISLAHTLQTEFNGTLDISLSGGADAENISELVACGLTPVTVCSDLLKPGGYGRLYQYIEELRLMFEGYRATSIEDYIIRCSGYISYKPEVCKLNNLKRYLNKVLTSKKYKRETIHTPSIKTNRELGFFDCIHAPCQDTCSTNQDIPNYIHQTANCNLTKAGEVILQTNPFPLTTGMICDHLCQAKCTRINYDGAVLIREIKRYVAETAISSELAKPCEPLKKSTYKRVSIIGAGPAGLSCAYFLKLAGFQVDIYESKPNSGGMVKEVIPSFRLTEKALQKDVERIKNLGVNVHYDQEIKGEKFNKIRGKGDYLFIGVGAQKSAKLNIKGSDAEGVMDPLILLRDIKAGDRPNLGKHVVIIGGGNTAMDVARTVYRTAPQNGKVTILYRRTIKQMPADIGEIKAVMEEGIEIRELVSPKSINIKNGKVTSVTCELMRLGQKDESGRQRPEAIPNSDFDIEVSSVIPAVGQEMVFDFGGSKPLTSTPGTYETQMPNVFLGGDALRGASTAINAIGDGRKVAQLIINREQIDFQTKPENERKPLEPVNHIFNRTRKLPPARITELPLSKRKNFNLVAATLTEDEIIDEAKRCLLCDEYCSICCSVCPNLANYTYKITPKQYQTQVIIGLNNKKVAIENSNTFNIEQPYQILNIANFCNECGNCNTFCPSSGEPYLKKPRVFLTESAYELEEQGFFLNKDEDGNMVLHSKSNGASSSLTEKEIEYIYENDSLIAVFSKETIEVKRCFFKEDAKSKEFETTQVIQMTIIMEGIKSYLYL